MSSTIQPHSYLFREEEEKGRESRAKGDALSGNGDEARGRLPRGLGLGTLRLLGHALSSVDLMDVSNWDNHGIFWLTHQTSLSFHQGIILPSRRQVRKPEWWG